jgi:hypothetical protein
MPRHLDIRLIVIVFLGVAAFTLVILLRSFGLNNVPDENVVYVDTAVGGIEDDDAPSEEINALATDEAGNNDNSALELIDEAEL